MAFWSWLFRRAATSRRDPGRDRAPRGGPIPLPTEPSVFECRECHKVFEARRRHPACPECDSADVELMSA